MTELMKRYEAETGEMATFIYTWIDKEGEEHSDSPSGYSFRLSFGVAFFSVDISGGSE